MGQSRKFPGNFRKALFLAASVASVWATSARAEFLPPPAQLMTTGQADQFNATVGRKLVGGGQPEEVLPALDALLLRLNEPSQFRGYVQFLRASILSGGSRGLDAVAAIDESIRLLPGYSGPLIVAADVYTYADRPGSAADFLMRASQIDPEIVRQIDDYQIGSLARRLAAVKDHRRLGMLSTRLLEIGWTGTGLQSKSDLAIEAIRLKVKSGDLAAARALLPDVLDPRELYTMLSENLYQPLWPDIEKWAGPKLERQWRAYLFEARGRFAATNNPEATKDYVTALVAAGRDDVMIQDVLPLFSGKIDPDEMDLVFVVPSLAGALAREGRWQDVARLFQSAEAIWPLENQPNALNVFANHARFLLFEGRPAEALVVMDKAIAAAKKWGGSVNSDAIAAMHSYRYCMLQELGRQAEAGFSMAMAIAQQGVETTLEMHLCAGNMDAARQTLLGALSREDDQGKVIRFMHAPIDGPYRSSYGAKLRQRRNQLRADPILLREVRKYGRILPFASNEGARSLKLDSSPAASDPEVTAGRDSDGELALANR